MLSKFIGNRRLLRRLDYFIYHCFFENQHEEDLTICVCMIILEDKYFFGVKLKLTFPYFIIYLFIKSGISRIFSLF